MMGKQESIPQYWAQTKFGSIIELTYGKGLAKNSRNDEGKYPVYGSNGIVGFHDRYLIEGPAIIVGRKGAAGIPTYAKDNCWPIDTTYYVKSSPAYDLKFLYHLIHSLRLNQFDRSTAIPGLNRDDAYGLNINLPPFNEQQRIVSKLEELLSELDKGIEAFKTAREQLTVYRQAVLKHAFEGKLTEEWRKKHADELEPTETLLEKIKAEREQRYRQQLDNWKRAVKAWEASGKEGKNPTKPGKPKELPPLTEEELSELPELPEGWGWVKLGQLTWSVKDGPHYSPKYEDEGIPFISGGNIRPNGIDFSSAKYISKELHEELSHRCKPEAGDILYSKGGTTGIARVNTYEIDFNVWVHVAVLKITESTEPFFLQNALNSSFCYAQAQKYTHGVGNQDLGLTRMVNIVLAICNLTEQCKVIDEIESRLSVAEKLEQEIADGLRQAEALRQSLLKKAFEGKLVSQDPDDEPASILLERIKTEKAKLKRKARKEKKVAV